MDNLCIAHLIATKFQFQYQTKLWTIYALPPTYHPILRPAKSLTAFPEKQSLKKKLSEKGAKTC
jgi:hypothetical protein